MPHSCMNAAALPHEAAQPPSPHARVLEVQVTAPVQARLQEPVVGQVMVSATQLSEPRHRMSSELASLASTIVAAHDIEPPHETTQGQAAGQTMSSAAHAELASQATVQTPPAQPPVHALGHAPTPTAPGSNAQGVGASRRRASAVSPTSTGPASKRGS